MTEGADDGASSPWLQDSWTVYHHSPSDPSWTLSSYHRIGGMSVLSDFWPLHGAMQPRLMDCMFFAMREHVFPCWDDKSNIDGGCVSFKVPVEHAEAFWEELFKRAVGETLVSPSAERACVVNGVSTSARRGGFCIFKVWLADEAGLVASGAVADLGSAALRTVLRVPASYRGELVYRSNRSNIQNDAKA